MLFLWMSSLHKALIYYAPSRESSGRVVTSSFASKRELIYIANDALALSAKPVCRLLIFFFGRRRDTVVLDGDGGDDRPFLIDSPSRPMAWLDSE